MTGGASVWGIPMPFHAPVEVIPELAESPYTTGEWRAVKTLENTSSGKVVLTKTRDGNLLSLPDLVAVKKIPKDRVAISNGLQSPLNEIHASREISNRNLRNVGKCYGAWQDAKFIYLVSQYFPNGELFTLVESGDHFKTEHECRRMAMEMLTAVLSLHRNGIAHRDISLENFRVDQDFRIHLIDFGQAIRVKAGNAPEEKCRVDKRGIPGKNNYVSPELLRPLFENGNAFGESYSAMKLDMYQVGVALFTVLVGTYPYARNQLAEVVGPDAVLYPRSEALSGRCTKIGDVIRASGRGHRISPECLDLLELLLAPNPDLRPGADEAMQHEWFAPVVRSNLDGGPPATVLP